MAENTEPHPSLPAAERVTADHQNTHADVPHKRGKGGKG